MVEVSLILCSLQLVQNDQQIQIVHVAICLIFFRARMNILYITNVKILVLMKYSYKGPPISCVTIEPRMLRIF